MAVTFEDKIVLAAHRLRAARDKAFAVTADMSDKEIGGVLAECIAAEFNFDEVQLERT